MALDALKGEQTLVEIAERYQIHPNQITEWKRQLLEHAPDIFSKDKKPEQGPSVKDLHAKIGQLSIASKERPSIFGWTMCDGIMVQEWRSLLLNILSCISIICHPIILK